MTNRPPPVPPENRSSAGPKDAGNPAPLDTSKDKRESDVNDERGRSADIAQNTTHQGYQQDR